MEASANSRIAKNTLLMYIRMVIVILINLYTSRVILATLGVDDFGIYNVVGGIVSMFVFLNTAMVAASQRFIAFEQGRSDTARQRKVYSTSVLIHLTIALIVVILSETAGLWFLNHKMNIPADRMVAANWVYQAAIICFVLKIAVVPDTSSVIAHEKMSMYAVASIINAILLLGAVFLLKAFRMDKLILYALLLIGVELVNFLIYRIYTNAYYVECHFSNPKDGSLYKEMLTFAGWSFLGNFGIALRGPGVNVIVNLFCGPAVNAARGIAYQVSSVVSNFVNNFQTALTPQITKRYAADEKSSMLALVSAGSRISFLLLAVIVVPLFIRADYVLDLWLETVPDMSVQFLRLILLVGLVNSMVGPITTAIQATGDIKVFQIVICLLMLLDMPLAYIMLRLGFEPYTVVYISIATEVAALVARIVILNGRIRVNLASYILDLLIVSPLLFGLMFLVPAVVDHFIPQSFLGLVTMCTISLAWSLTVIYIIGLKKSERSFINEYIKKKYDSIFVSKGRNCPS